MNWISKNKRGAQNVFNPKTVRWTKFGSLITILVIGKVKANGKKDNNESERNKNIKSVYHEISSESSQSPPQSNLKVLIVPPLTLLQQ